ncbi:hypothetical protein PENNAL_c0017G01039 [Penicillium nalgiovense]|uniref:Uncharacterized protein n=1 Tax=Penicillium nalgiovense TaxID=60175 RepID=A0A1V6YLQ3_PENNA|nr:hypothetical protein PENNAL_c0017G01039 [Penicillium nalgiovense]
MPPVYHGQWSFDGDTFYVTSSSGHVHPRATYSELDDIFSTPLGDRRNRADYQDHWYEAQLLHFGLPPTKSKATAKMRLMDAFQDGTLDVPEQILEMEHKLTRTWMKQDLEARILGPSMQPPLDPEITGATATDATERGAAQRPSGNEEGMLFGASLVRGSDQSTRPLKTARRCGGTGGLDLHQIHVNTNGETFHQISTGTPVSVGNGRGRPASDGDLQQVGYRAVPLLHHTSYEMAQLPPVGVMNADGA